MVNLIPFLIICGLVWWFLRCRRINREENLKKTTSLPVLVDAKHSVYVRPDSKDEQRIAALHREATEHKSNKEWVKAIGCLREAERLKGDASTVYPVKHSLRLPLFLQQAGRFDEAMQEFQKLLDDTEKRVLAWLPKRNIASKKMLIHADLYEIYGSMATACKRERLSEQAKKYSVLYEKHKKAHALLLKNR